MGFPYIYIYCISISRVFSCFLTIFARFWILSIFCALYPGKSLFFKDRPISRVYLIFFFGFFGPIQRDGIFVFIDFLVFWPFLIFGLFLSIGFLALFFIVFLPFF